MLHCGKPRRRQKGHRVLLKTFVAPNTALGLVQSDPSIRFKFRTAPVVPIAADPPFARAIDVGVALVALMFFAPLMLLIAAAVWQSGSPVLFRHKRVGRGGRTFSCLKFRTMHTDSDRILAELLATDPVARAEWARDHKLRRDPRISCIGAILRKTSLDELPQLFNVLGGTMSIVGPRPIVQAEAVRYGRYFWSYCLVRPGITGLWQISGRNTTTYRRRVACDVAYVRGKSAKMDLQIMFRTVPAVIFRHGAF